MMRLKNVDRTLSTTPLARIPANLIKLTCIHDPVRMNITWCHLKELLTNNLILQTEVILMEEERLDFSNLILEINDNLAL